MTLFFHTKESKLDLNENILIELALKEDLGDVGDVSSISIFDKEEDEFFLVAKDSGVICGVDVFKKVFLYVDDSIKVDFRFKDGDFIKEGDHIATISGKVVSILQAERTGINFLSHLSAISTKTAKFVKEANGKVTILDTRKTLPGYRMLQKYAVKCGGGENHRIGLFDMAMLKDNHNDSAGGISNAVKKVRDRFGKDLKIEVETRNLDEVKEALSLEIDRIMLDNMSNEDTKTAVDMIAKKVEVEASGNMSFERIKSVSETGVDFISFGELTHSVAAFDFSLRKRL